MDLHYQDEATEISVPHFSQLTTDANISCEPGSAHPICKRLMTILSESSKWFFILCMNGVYLNESAVFPRVWGENGCIFSGVEICLDRG